jgi:Fibronectin type III domain.
MKKYSTFLILLLCLINMGIIPKAYGQATLPYSQDFSAGNDFTLNNGTQTNKWFHGAVTGNPGNSLFISNDNGVTNAYTVNSSSVVQAYRDFTIPAGSTIATFSFDWKAAGESTWDYLRVWLVPATFNPTAGTQIGAGAGRTQIGQFNLQTTWQTYMSPTLNISAYAGSTMRLVFEWRNDGILGAQPPVAIDNINLFIPTCLVPSNMAVGTVTANSATLSWTAPSPVPANGYEYYLSTTNSAPTAGTSGTPVTGTSVNLGATLTPNTTYYWWVRAVCSSTDSSIWMPGPNFTTTQIPATIPYFQNFDTSNDLGFTSGTQANKWYYGSATGNPANSIYISNDNGVTNGYNVNSSSVVHAYRDIAVPTGTTLAYLLFDWKGFGESTFDYLRVWMVPSSFMPTAGTQITAGAGRIQIGGNFNQQTTWQNYLNTAVNLSSFAGGTMRLVFEWRNDGIIGTQPAIAVDNIHLLIPSCFVPTAMGVTTVTSTTAAISWNAPNPVPANGYQIYYNTTGIPPTAATVGTAVAGTSTTLSPLTPNTTYYWWVRSMCSPTNPSIWVAGPSFTTTQIPATIPYYQPFTGPNDFGFTSGTQTNKWAYGAATGNPGNSIYISNDAGVSNAYTITTTSVTHAYRDIAVPAGTTIAKLSFDWKAQGESSFDYLRVWLVPATYMPNAGTQITAGTGRVQLGANYNLQNTWQSYLNNTLNLSTFAGSTMRLVFEWRNDGSGGTQPPVAIDNVKLLICSTATPVITLGAPTHNSIVLTWPQNSGEASYTVRYRPVGSPTWDVVTVPAQPYPTPTNTTTLTGLMPATLYEVEVAAVCNTTTGMYSHQEFTTRCDPTPPNVTISNITTNSAQITWTPLATSATYYLRYRIVGTTGWTDITLPLPPANTITLTGLNIYTTYEVQIANKCDNETTLNAYSSPQVFTTERTCEIAPPGLTITNITTTSAVVVWDPFPGATYILRYRKVGIPSWTEIPVAVNTYTLTGLLELTKYEMQVANVCSGTPGNYTPLYYFITPTVVHCPMSSQNSANEYISKVTVKPNGKPTMENTSGASNYTDYTGVPAALIELIQGSTGNEISIENTWVGANNDEGISSLDRL